MTSFLKLARCYCIADTVRRSSDENIVGNPGGQLTTPSAQPLHYMYTHLSTIQSDKDQTVVHTRELNPDGYSEPIDSILYSRPKCLKGQSCQPPRGDKDTDDGTSGLTCVENNSLEGRVSCEYSVPSKSNSNDNCLNH